MGIDPIGGIPFQLKFVRAAQMLLFSNALCDPPLGQTTVINSNQDVVGFSPSSSSLSLFSVVVSDYIHGITGVEQVVS